MGTAKGKQPTNEALCQPPPPLTGDLNVKGFNMVKADILCGQGHVPRILHPMPALFGSMPHPCPLFGLQVVLRSGVDLWLFRWREEPEEDETLGSLLRDIIKEPMWRTALAYTKVCVWHRGMGPWGVLTCEA